MKVLHVTMSGSFGGAETVIFSIIDALNNQCQFYYLSPQGPIEDNLKGKNIKHVHFNKKKLGEFKKNIKEINPDVIHAHDFMASVLCAILVPQKYIISHLHTSHKWIKIFSIKSIIFLFLSIFFNEIIVVSHTMFKEFCISWLLRKKIRIITNPIELATIQRLSEEYEIDKSYDVAFLGRLSSYKNPIKFVEIVSKSSSIKSSILIGDGELKDKCLQTIQEKKIEHLIDLVGFQKNPFPYLKKTKILIVPSKVEALGLSAMQALSLGIPVVAMNTGGLKDFIRNGENGFLCKTNQEFVERVEYLLENKTQYNSFADNARISAEKFINTIDYSQHIMKLYDKVNGGNNE